MHPDLPPPKPHFWFVFAFLIYWPVVAALALGALVAGGEAVRPALILIGVVSALVLIAGVSGLLFRLRPRSLA